MGAHVYAYGLRLDSEGSATLMSTWAEMVRITPETSPNLRISPTVIANLHGDIMAERAFYNNYDFNMEIQLSYGTPETTTKVYENRSEVLQRMTDHTQRVWIERDTTYQGVVEIPIRTLRGPRTTDPDHRLGFICRTVEPFWRDASVTHSAVNPVSGVTNGGDAPIHDAVVEFSGHNGVQRLTNTTTGEYIEVDTDTSVEICVVDIGARTIKKVGLDVDDQVSFESADPWWMEVVRGANSFTLSGGGSATLTARDKWL